MDGGDADDSGGSDEDAENRQKGTELVGPEGVQGQQQVLANVLPSNRHAYISERKASIGCSLAAWLAG